MKECRYLILHLQISIQPIFDQKYVKQIINFKHFVKNIIIFFPSISLFGLSLCILFREHFVIFAIYAKKKKKRTEKTLT